MKPGNVVPIKARAGDEEDVWQADVIRLPTWVKEEDRPPFRPAVGVALSRRTGMVGSSQPDAAAADASGCLFAALDDLAAILGGLPAAIQLRNEAVAPAVRQRLAQDGVRVEVVPVLAELDAFAATLNKRMSSEAGPPSLLSVAGMTAGAITSFAEGAAEFFAAAPWHVLVPEDVIRIDAPRPDPGARYASVLGFGASEFGIMILDSEDAWEAIRHLGAPTYIRDHSVWSVTASEPFDVPFPELDLWEEKRLPTVVEGKFPVAICFGPKRRVRRPSPRMLAFFEGLLRALAATTDEELDTGRWRKAVETAQGPMEFTFALPAVLDVTLGNLPSEKLRPALFQARAHRQIQRLLAERDFASLEEANRFLDSRLTSLDLDDVQPATPQEQAQEMAALAAASVGRARVVLARKALAVWPDCADAYTALGNHSATAEAALGFYEQAVAAGQRAIGSEAFSESAGHFWGVYETRPYMRARLALAQTLWELGRKQEAVVHYRELLRLNRNDNQGVRELVVPAMLSLGDDAGAEEILAMYKNDALPSTAYNRALLEFRREGDSAAGRRLLTRALARNPHVPKYLVGDAELPEDTPERVTLGGDDEAAAYAVESLAAWQATPGASDWLRARGVGPKRADQRAAQGRRRSARGATSKKKSGSRGAGSPSKHRSQS